MDRMADEKTKKLLERAAGTFWGLLGCRLVAFRTDKAVIELEAGPAHLNHLGIVHGGVYASLLDQAMGIAAMAARPSDTVVTTNLNVHYTASTRTGLLQATASLVHASKKMLTAQARVTDANGVICAWGSGTFRVIQPIAEEGERT